MPSKRLLGVEAFAGWRGERSITEEIPEVLVDKVTSLPGCHPEVTSLYQATSPPFVAPIAVLSGNKGQEHRRLVTRECTWPSQRQHDDTSEELVMAECQAKTSPAGRRQGEQGSDKSLGGGGAP